jgi:hypothetical protein
MTVQVSVPLDLKKVLVAFNKFEFFIRGFYQIQPNSKSTKFNQVEIPESVFVTDNNKWFDTFDFNHRFNCNYNGTGPGNLVRFLEDYTDRETLEDVIFHNPIVEYDFTTNEITPMNNYFGTDDRLNIAAKKDGKLIFFVGNDTDMLANDIISKEVIFITKVMKQLSNRQSKPQEIIYVGDADSEEYQYYSSEHIHTRYNLIIRFQDFEIWINHFFGRGQHDIQFDESFKDFLSQINISLLDEKYNNSFHKFIDKIKARKLESQSNQYIPIHFE